MTNKHVLNINIPHWTHQQLEDIKREQGTTKTQVVITAVDHYKREGQGYNGWVNYETWCVNLWLTNEQGTYFAMREMAKEAGDEYAAAGVIKEWVEEMNPLADDATMFSDMLNAALREVNWNDIARHALEE